MPALPEGLRIYAIGDIHGRFDLLSERAADIRRDRAEAPPARTIELFLGDYVDRGPQTKEVLDWLIGAPPLADQRICLLGNHEAMLLDALADPYGMDLWLANGGDATLHSYGIVPNYGSVDLMDRLSHAFATALPASHATFLRSLPRQAAFGTYLFVHAGIRPDRPVDQQDPNDLIWIREPFLRSKVDFGCIVVHGHTPVEQPEIRRNRIDIDTGAVFSDRLTCLVLESTTLRFI